MARSWECKHHPKVWLAVDCTDYVSRRPLRLGSAIIYNSVSAPTMELSPVLRIVKYPHPALRHKSKPLRRVDGELKNVVREMFDLMYQHKGIGLAANQVNLPYRLFIINTEGDPAKGQEYVFINPVISKRSGTAEAEEGCLSFPEILRPREALGEDRHLRLQPRRRGDQLPVDRLVRPRGPARIRPPRRRAVHRPPDAQRPAVGQAGADRFGVGV